METHPGSAGGLRLGSFVAVATITLALFQVEPAFAEHDCGSDWRCLAKRARTCGPARAVSRVGPPKTAVPAATDADCIDEVHTIRPDAEGHCRRDVTVDREAALRWKRKVDKLSHSQIAEARRAMAPVHTKSVCYARPPVLQEILRGLAKGNYRARPDETCVPGLPDCASVQAILAPGCKATRCRLGRVAVRCATPNGSDTCEFTLDTQYENDVTGRCKDGYFAFEMRFDFSVQ